MAVTPVTNDGKTLSYYMTLTKDITAKFAVAAVAVAMIFAAFAPSAQAQTTEDLQQMINDLLAQVAQLQAQTGGTTGGGSASDVCPYTWTRDLTMGSEGADVMKLQQFLNDTPDLRVAPAGSPGSAGMETMYYGPATAAAVSKMQVMFRAEVLTPNGLVNPTGYFGPSSRAKANGLCIADAVVTPTPDTDEDGMEDEDEDGNDNASMTLQGEGTLTTFEIDDEESEVSEGEEDVPVMRLTMEAENGDIEVSRLAFELTADNNVQNQEDEPWDAFEEVSLWIDGDKIASFDASDEDEYLNDDAGTESFRFSNLDLILEEDEEVEVLVAVSVMNSVDGADVTDAAKWKIEPISVRYFDADGVATTEDDVGEMTGADDSETFDIEVEGVDDGADLEGSSNTPDDNTEVVDEDTDDSDEYVVHVFDIEVDNDSSDLEVGDVYATTTMTNPNGTDIDGQEDVIDGIFMTIDGETVEGEAVNSGSLSNDTESATTTSGGGSTSVVYLFEFDQDVVLEGDEDYEVEISMVFKGQDNDTNYADGVTVVTEVNGSDWEVEGSDSDNELEGTDTSETLTLSSADVDVTNYGWTSPDAGTFLDFKFTVEANEEDYDVLLADFAYATSGTATTTGPVLSRTAGDATENVAGSDYTVENGDTATFRIRWNLNGVNGDTFDVTATSVAGRTIPDDEEVSPTVIRNVN